MKTINIFKEGRVLEPITYSSGRRVADPGDRVQVEVGPTTWWVYAFKYDDVLELIYTTQDPDWVVRHLIL